MVVLLALVVDLRQLWHALSQLTIESILYLAILSFALIFISALKWQLFLEAGGQKVSVWRLCSLYLVGYFVNLVLPSYIGGDMVRSWYAGQKVGQHEAATATILERYTGLVAMIALATIFVWFVGEITIQIKLVVIIIAIGLAVGSWLALQPALIRQFEKMPVVGKFAGHLKKVQEGFNLARSNHTLLVKALALSFIFHTITVLNTVVAAGAVGWGDPPIWDLFVVLPLILLLAALPVAPSGLGLQEGAFYFFLHGVGANSGQALGVGIVLRAKSYVLALLGGLIWLRLKRNTGNGSRNTPEASVSETRD
jgi:uncharacterized protein (TIRG00374 family)